MLFRSRVLVSNGWRFAVIRDVTVDVRDGAVVERVEAGERVPAAVGGAAQGERVVVWTSPVSGTLDEQLGKPRALAAARILFRG